MLYILSLKTCPNHALNLKFSGGEIIALLFFLFQAIFPLLPPASVFKGCYILFVSNSSFSIYLSTHYYVFCPQKNIKIALNSHISRLTKEQSLFSLTYSVYSHLENWASPQLPSTTVLVLSGCIISMGLSVSSLHLYFARSNLLWILSSEFFISVVLFNSRIFI